MRIGQDLCIALVLAVVGAAACKPAIARSDAERALEVVEKAMAGGGFSDADVASVRNLIAQARQRERMGDEDGAILAMTGASAILGIT